MIDFATRSWRALLVFVGLLGVATLPLLAPSQTFAQAGIVLTDNQVTGFIASYPAIIALSEELQGKSAGSSGEDVTASLGALMTYQDAMGRLNETVGAHGFASYTEWVTVAGAIMTAYTFASQGGAMDAQMQAAIDAIEANPNLTADQKAAMRQQFEQATASMNAAKPPQANIDVVNAHADELEAVLDIS